MAQARNTRHDKRTLGFATVFCSLGPRWEYQIVEDERNGKTVTDSRPNIILIITDQQRYDAVSALGFPYLDTPNLARLDETGGERTNGN